MISIDNRDPRPLYEQVVDGFRKLIVAGVLGPDEKLPSVRSLATQLAINPNTIQRAYRELEMLGYTYSSAMPTKRAACTCKSCSGGSTMSSTNSRRRDTAKTIWRVVCRKEARDDRGYSAGKAIR